MWNSQTKKNKAIRISSAPKTTQKQQYDKTRLKTQISQYPNEIYKRHTRIKTAYQNSQIWKIIPQKTGKDREQLFEENLQLRKRINELETTITLGRTKIEHERKKNIHITKKLQNQFEKEIYWTGSNNHLISGIKSQYEKLKLQYNNKCQQLEKVKKNTENTSLQQCKAYIETLQEHITELMTKVQSSKGSLDINLYKNTNMQYAVSQAYKENQKIIRINTQINQKVTQLQAKLKEKTQKIEFIEKLLIEKDNNQYRAFKKANKTEKDNKILEEKITKLQEEVLQNEKKYKQQFDKINNFLNKRYQVEKQMFQRQLQDKNYKIVKLQKEISYLSTLLSYWKPLDEWRNQEINENDPEDESEKEIQLETKVRKQSYQNLQATIIREKTKSIASPMLNPLNTDQSKNSRSRNSNRIPRSAKQKNSQNSLKMRKVSFRQVEDFSPILRYRLIAQQIPKQSINNYLVSTSKDSWSKEYITMAQVKYILQEAPFFLKETNAHLISRYIIEDCNQEHVYCDDTNELSRTMAKSILKALIGQYEIPNLNQTQPQLKAFLIKYQRNLKAALSSIAPTGYIPGTKLIQLLYSLGMELSKGCQDMILGKMMMVSEQESKMKYEVIFE